MMVVTHPIVERQIHRLSTVSDQLGAVVIPIHMKNKRIHGWRKYTKICVVLSILFSILFLHMDGMDFKRSFGIETLILKSKEGRYPTCIKGVTMDNPVELYIYTVPFHGPTYVPPDIPPDVPLDLPWPNLPDTVNQQRNMTSEASSTVIPVRRQAAHVADTRDIGHTSTGNSVSEAQRICLLTDGNTSNTDVTYDVNNDYISLRSNRLFMSLRQERNLSSLSREESSQLKPTLNTFPDIRGALTQHVLYAGTCSKVGNDKFPSWEISARPTLHFLDGAGSTSANLAPRRDANHDEEFTGHEEERNILFNMTLSTPFDSAYLQNLSVHSAREETFIVYPWQHQFLTPNQMANAGFFYTGVRDVVRCFFCGICLDDWKPGDDPLEEHRAGCPDCTFVRFQSPRTVQNAASGITMVAETEGQVDTSSLWEEMRQRDTGGANIGQPLCTRSNTQRCAYEQSGEQNARHRLDPHAEPDRAIPDRKYYGPDTARCESREMLLSESPGIQDTTTYITKELNNNEDEALQEGRNGTYSARTATRGRPGSQDTQPVPDSQANQRIFAQQHERDSEALQEGRNGTYSARTATRERPGSQDTQPVPDSQENQRISAQQHELGHLSALRFQRNHGDSQEHRRRLTDQRIAEFLESDEGTLILHIGYSRTDVARALHQQGIGTLSSANVMHALRNMGARLRCKEKKRKFSE